MRQRLQQRLHLSFFLSDPLASSCYRVRLIDVSIDVCSFAQPTAQMPKFIMNKLTLAATGKKEWSRAMKFKLGNELLQRLFSSFRYFLPTDFVYQPQTVRYFFAAYTVISLN